MTNPIERHWNQILEHSNGFCCEEHREAMRAMYFAGAMAALTEMTGWDPEAPEVLFLHMDNIRRVREEMTAAYHADVTPIDLVRH